MVWSLGRLWVVLFLFLFSACGVTPRSAYAKADAVRGQVEPVLVAAFQVLAGSGGSGDDVQPVLNSLGALLSAWNHGDARRFDALVPCVRDALVEASKAVPGVKPAAGVLAALEPEAACVRPAAGDEDDAGVL